MKIKKVERGKNGTVLIQFKDRRSKRNDRKKD